MTKKIKNKKPKISFTSMDDFEKKFFIDNSEAIEAFFNETLADYLKTGNKDEFINCLGKVVKWIGVSNVATKAKLTRQGVYNAIKAKSSPSFTTVLSVLHGAGFNFNINYSRKI